MERREFLKASCYTGLASLAAGATTVFGQDDVPARLPGETTAAYRARIARLRALQAAHSSDLTGPPTAEEMERWPRLPGETDAAYQARIGRLRVAADPTQLPGETDAAYQARMARLRAVRAAQARLDRQIYELRRYTVESEAQKKGFDAFAAEAFIPVLNRLDAGRVGVFYPSEGLSPVYVLLVHRSMDSFTDLTANLMKDREFLSKGVAFLDAPAAKPAYQRLEVQLMQAFESMPRLERPIDNPERILQLRTYESSSMKTGLKKIEMFNTAEIEIFRKTGLHPVFFGQTLAGQQMPNLTYMLAFKDMAESKANWSTFTRDPDWQQLRAKPEYADKEIVSKITNLYLKPADYSQI
ncbi:MAG: NIPSNAP family protein [Sedimentisphaerales bacterium]|nr:NIPSNAP family protein [Sedimentisphaerales bacterium]